MAQDMRIGELAKRTGCKVQTVRYYEQIGLLPAPPRTQGGQRLYGEAEARRLAFIRHGRELGFGLDAIRALLAMADAPHAPCGPADAIARRQLVEVEHRMARLASLRAELKRMIEACEGAEVAECRVIESLADHGLCLAADHAAPDAPVALSPPRNSHA